MIWIFCGRNSDGANVLAEAVQGQRLRRFDGTTFYYREGRPAAIGRGDVIVCWGVSLPARPDTKIVNGCPMVNKLDAALKLKEAEVPTVEVSRTRPTVTPVPDHIHVAAANYTRIQLRELMRGIQIFLDSPEPALRTWLPRKLNHIGGHDLLRPPTRPDYWTQKENLVREYRVHMFKGNSIRAGVKIPVVDDRPVHEWIRSLEAGWRINYDGFTSSTEMRQLAVRAVKTLGLQFGAVDIGEKADGSLLVLEVNRAPGLEGGTVDAYARAIRRVR